MSRGIIAVMVVVESLSVEGWERGLDAVGDLGITGRSTKSIV